MIRALLTRELALLWLERGRTLMPLAYFALVVLCFTLGTDPDPARLAELSPAIVWLACALALIPGSERLYAEDFREGLIEQYLVAELPLAVYALLKLLADWVAVGLPLALAATAVSAAIGLPAGALPVQAGALLLGSFVLCALSGFLSGLSLALRRPGVLQPLLMLPLAVPTVIFGAGAARLAAEGAAAAGPLYFLGGLALLSLGLMPLATAAALRNALDS